VGSILSESNNPKLLKEFAEEMGDGDMELWKALLR
jgi:hypothetical protein